MKTAKSILEKYGFEDYLCSTELINDIKSYANNVAKESLNDAAMCAKVILIDPITKQESSMGLVYIGANCIIPDTKHILKSQIKTP